MAIPENQLDTWSAQGSVQQSAATYQTIRNVLNDEKSPYYEKSYHIFLQGSYGNDTNVYRDSDVDIVIRLNDTYYQDLDELTEMQKQAFNNARVPATFGYNEFKGDVLSWLTTNYGSDVQAGSKAIAIKANKGRRDADVLPCTQFRHYYDHNGVSQYHEGICFWRTDGVRIVNYPKQHSENCTSKHQNTKLRFKPNVRVFKNIRNRMVDDNLIRDGLAPSYFIEGMLWNVPNNLFESSFGDTFVNAVNWLRKRDKKNLSCANDRYYLLRDGVPVCWNQKDFDAFLDALVDYWNNW